LIAVVTDVVSRDLQDDWGSWRERDGRDESGLRVDVTFEACNIALELTSLQDPELLAAGDAAGKVECQLTAFVRERRLTGWVVEVSSHASLKRIADAVRPLMVSGIEISPMAYSSRDLADAEAKGELRELRERHRRLDRLGLLRLTRRPGSNSVFVMVVGSGFQVVGFTELIAKELRANAAKLGEARPRETHLAILVGRWDLSAFPAKTAPPALPDEIDVLWIVHPAWGRSDALVWMAHRGDDDWRLRTSTTFRYG